MATATEQGLVFDIRLELEKLLKDAQKARQVLTGIGDTAKREGEAMDATFRKLGSTIAGVFAADQLRQFAMQVVRVRGEFQQLEVAFRTMLQSKAKADDLMAQAVEFAAITPFGLQDVATGAKQLLASGSGTIEEISRLCGFRSSGYFCRMFRKHTGLTPGQYRKAFL